MAGNECPDAIKPFRWKKGQSGNPKGRPKRKSFEELVEGLLDQATVKIGENQINAREAIAGRLIEMLVLGNEKALATYLDRVWPKLQRHEIELPAIGSDALETALDRFKLEQTEPVSGKSNGGSET